jgi:3-hydroxyacyl-[acyl-carrier-protein] dehydratase
LRIEVDVLSLRTRAGKIHGRATVDGKLACEATLMCAVVTRERERRAHGDNPDTNPAEENAPTAPGAE